MDAEGPDQNSQPLSISTIGEELTITGNVSSTGELHINGLIRGEVHCVAFVLGETAQIEGCVVAEDVMLRGHLIGKVCGSRVMLQSPAHVEGDLFYKSLSIEQGAYFEGECRPLEIPLSAKPGETKVDSQSSEMGILMQ